MGADWALAPAENCRSKQERRAETEPVAGTSREAGATGLEPATSGVTGRRSNQLSYAPGGGLLSIAGASGSRFVGDERNFRRAGEFEPRNRSPEDAPNPAVGALLGSATGTLHGVPVVLTRLLVDVAAGGRTH